MGHAPRLAWISLALCGFAAGAGCEKIIGAEFGNARLVECTPAVPLDPPGIRNAGGDLDLTFATYSLDVGEARLSDGSPSWVSKGFDLDGRCTSAGDRRRCITPPWTGLRPIDGRDGRDNGIGALMSTQKEGFGVVVLRSTDLTTSMQNGKTPPFFVLRVTGYNGLADDDVVVVSWYVPTTLRAGSPGDAGVVAPKWDGTDEWPLIGETLKGGVGPPDYPSLFVDASAYVSKYHVVAHYPGGGQVQLDGVRFDISSALITGVLGIVSGSEWVLTDGVVGGRIAESQMFARLPEFTKQLVGVRLCSTDPNYPSIKKFFCAAADVLLKGDGDGTAACDGISFGAAFEGKRAKLGPVVDSPRASLCNPSDDPANDSCARP